MTIELEKAVTQKLGEEKQMKQKKERDTQALMKRESERYRQRTC